jgi:diacylglycerol kinase (ATP)
VCDYTFLIAYFYSFARGKMHFFKYLFNSLLFYFLCYNQYLATKKNIFKDIMHNKTHTTTAPFKRIWNAMIFSFNGIKATFETEAAFRQDLIVFAINCLLLFLVHERYFVLWLFFCGIFLLFAELVNTGIECVVDYISHDIHPLAKKAKDIGSALVFLALFNLLISWGVYVYPFVMKWLHL